MEKSVGEEIWIIEDSAIDLDIAFETVPTTEGQVELFAGCGQPTELITKSKFSFVLLHFVPRRKLG
jgi:hypothetical protein